MFILHMLRVFIYLLAVSLFFKGFFPLKKINLETAHKTILDISNNLQDQSTLMLSKKSTTNENESKKMKESKDNFDTLGDSFEKTQNISLSDNKIRLNQINDTQDLNKNIGKKTGKFKLPFQRLILVIIDAFRADFFFGNSKMPKLYNIIKKGHGLNFIAESQPPTVTMPRIKAITTGDIPSFVDVIFNFGSSTLVEDNIISQLHKNGKRIHFFGDDTWIKLFPDHFKKSDGTTSFFVSDFTEVDYNVSRHLPNELQSKDWDVMILHYLGLDHIGHTAGPKSSLVKPKLKEMDNVIKKIYTAMTHWDESSMLVVCGDHGMTDQGGHGGASPKEIAVPLLFLSPQIKNSVPSRPIRVSQMDMCPTLAVLMNVPVPINNLGTIITDTLVNLNLRGKVAAVQQNLKQSVQVLKRYVDNFQKESSYLLLSGAHDQYKIWSKSETSLSMHEWEEQGRAILRVYSEVSSMVALRVAKLSTQYDLYAMRVAMGLAWMLFASLILSHLGVELHQSTVLPLMFPLCGSFILTHITMCTGDMPSNVLCEASMMSLTLQLCVLLVSIGLFLHLWQAKGTLTILFNYIKNCSKVFSIVEVFVFVGSLSHAFSLASSSYVEEEHQTAYFLITSLTLLLLLVYLRDLWQGVFATQDVKETIQQSVVGSTDIGNTNNDADCDIQLYENSYSYRLGCLKNNSRKLPQRAVMTKKPINNKTAVSLVIGLIAVLICLRVMRHWNQTGNKWLHLPDYGDWLILAKHKLFLSTASALSMVMLSISRMKTLSLTQFLLMNLAFVTTYASRAAQGSLFFSEKNKYMLSNNGVVEARYSLCCSLLIIVLSLVKPSKNYDQTHHNIILTESEKGKEHCNEKFVKNKKNYKSENQTVANCSGDHLHGIVAGWLCVMCQLVRPHNIPMILMAGLLEQTVCYTLPRLQVNWTTSLFYCLWMSRAAFFFQGNSNSISTVDVSAGYVAMSEYNPFIVGSFMFMATFSGPILWLLGFLRAMYQYRESHLLKSTLKVAGHSVLLGQVLLFSVYTLVISTHRYHLFVWTVFSPKMLYMGVEALHMSAYAASLYFLSYFTKPS